MANHQLIMESINYENTQYHSDYSDEENNTKYETKLMKKTQSDY